MGEQPPVVTRGLDSMLPSAGCFDSSAQPDEEPFGQYVPSIVLPQTHSLMPSVGTWIAMKPRLGVSPAPDPPKRLMDLPSHELKMMHRSELIDAMKEELKRKDEEIEVLRRKVGNCGRLGSCLLDPFWLSMKFGRRGVCCRPHAPSQQDDWFPQRGIRS